MIAPPVGLHKEYEKGVIATGSVPAPITVGEERRKGDRH
jgi:hypothetical protein